MNSYLDIHTTTDVKPEMLSGVQTGNGIPHDMIYAALPVGAQTEKTTFSYKDDKGNYMYFGVGVKDL